VKRRVSAKSDLDWPEASVAFDRLRELVLDRDLSAENEAQTRFDVIDRLIRDVLGWQHGQVAVEEATDGARAGFVDYVLRAGDRTVVVEAKRYGAAFPSPTRRARLKLNGTLLSTGEVGAALRQVHQYALDKEADLAIVTNGRCWCYYAVQARSDDSEAGLLSPFDRPDPDARLLYELLAEPAVRTGSLADLLLPVPRTEDRLLSVVRDADGRVDRNNVADHLLPALDRALYADALLSDVESLGRCFVSTEARTKFDATLGMHFADPKPLPVEPARRIRKGEAKGALAEMVERASPSYAPPVTLIIGPVGAGKSTYLKHFELVAGRSLLQNKKSHWVYVDFAPMGRADNPRRFIYSVLRDYLQTERPDNPTDYKALIGPAYEEEIKALARGPLAPVYGDKPEFNRRVTDHISADFDSVEPYVDKVFRYLAQRQLCVVVLDNVDLYEDDDLETKVFAEGLALSKRIHCHVIVSLRDQTFVRHRTDSAFDAYELRKLWLDPPPFRAVLSSRLSFAGKVLDGKSADIEFSNGMHLSIPNLGDFFEIVQRSVLQGPAGDFVDSLAGGNIRRGLLLTTNFLTSGHIQADRAIKTVLDSDSRFSFPFHEVFKGSILGQWRHYKEGRAELINVFDSRLGATRLTLLRLFVLNCLIARARTADAVNCPVSELADILGRTGASESQVVTVVEYLRRQSFVRESAADAVTPASYVSITPTGGYVARVLAQRMPYVEECMLDTAICDAGAWAQLRELTIGIEHEPSIAHRMDLRVERLNVFTRYLQLLEEMALSGLESSETLRSIGQVAVSVQAEAAHAQTQAHRYYE
jgi:hypothetical protein